MHRLTFLLLTLGILCSFGSIQAQSDTKFHEVELSASFKTFKVELKGVKSQSDMTLLLDKFSGSNSILEINGYFSSEGSNLKIKSNLNFSPIDLRNLLLPLGFDITLDSIITNNDRLKQEISHNEKTL